MVLLAAALISAGLINSTFDYTVLADGEGIWQYVGVDYIDPPTRENQTTSISVGYASQRVVSPEIGDVYEASVTWTSPGSSYEAGQIVKINISVQIDNYVWNGEDDGYIHMGLNYMSTYIAARIDITDIGYGGATGASISLEDADGNYKCEVSTDNGNIVKQSESREIFAEFPSGWEDGEQISVHVHSQGGLARYNYVWHAAPVETTLPVETEPEDTYVPEPTDEWTEDQGEPEQDLLQPVGPDNMEGEAIVDWLRRLQNSSQKLGMGEKGEIDDMYGRLGQEIDRIAAGGEVDAERIIRIRDYISKRASGEHVTPDDHPPEESTMDLMRKAAIETGRNLSQASNEDGSTSWSGQRRTQGWME